MNDLENLILLLEKKWNNQDLVATMKESLGNGNKI